MFKFFTKTNNELTDEQLFQGSVNGCEDMFEKLYSRYKQRILYYFYRMLNNNESLAQDFSQELFFKILNKSELFNPDKKFSTWLSSIAHNMCKNEYRGREVRKIIVNSDQLDQFIDEDKESGNEKQKSIELIYNELNKLDESHRTAFLLKYREGFDLKEISDILNLPIGTVKSRLFYARKKIASNISSAISIDKH
jgi:RNA polymerase sigma-70 factor (ECF subfamily)